MSDHDARAILRKAQLLGRLPEESLNVLGSQSVIRTYRRGQLLFGQGDAGDALYVMAEGVVKLVRTSADGKELLLDLRRPHEVFGEIALLDGGERPAAAEAMRTPTRVLIIRREPLLELVEKSPVLSGELLVSFGALLREAIERAFDYVFLDLKGRVSKVLIEFARDIGTPVEEGTAIELDLHQGEVAALVGGSRPAVNKILKDLESRGYIRLEGRRITVLQPQQLIRRAGY